MANVPDGDHDSWEPPDVAAEGIVWMLRQPMPYTGWRESMYELGQREGEVHRAPPPPCARCSSTRRTRDVTTRGAPPPTTESPRPLVVAAVRG